jgi:ubiquitin fusion degradation protein 1
MRFLDLNEGDFLTVRGATLPKGTFVKFKPHSKDFYDIYSPKAVFVYFL